MEHFIMREEQHRAVLMEHFIVREEHHRAVREQQYEYNMAPPAQEDRLKIMLERLGKLAEQKALADYKKQNYHLQETCAYKGPYLQTTVVQQQPPMVHKVQFNTIDHHEGNHHQPGSHYLRTGISQPVHVQQPNMGNQAPPSKKHGGVMDCNEVAKLFGGVVLIDYGKNNKFPLRA